MVVTSSSGGEDNEDGVRRMSARSFEKRNGQSASTAEAESIKLLLLLLLVLLIIVRIYGSRDKRERKYFCAVAKSIFRRFLHLVDESFLVVFNAHLRLSFLYL